jgi:hypothetical protein
MAAELLDQQTDGQSQTDALPTDGEAMSQADLVASLTPTDTTANEDLTPVDTDEDLPDKYRGKSIKEIVSMHQEAEKLVGRQGGELGGLRGEVSELRGVVDSYIQGQMSGRAQEQHSEDPVDFFEDPEKAVSKAIETHPAVQQATIQAQQMSRQAAMARMQQAHPDAQDVLQDPKFADWVSGSRIRTELYQRADKNFDFDAADELLSLYKERQGSAQQAVQVEQVARSQQLKAAQTGSGSGANTSGSKRIYRRADIIKLMKTDPDRYDALQPEILAAYAEGRVK